MLKIIESEDKKGLVEPCQALSDHYKLMEGYFLSYQIRNLAESTIKQEEHFLRSWFEGIGPEYRPAYTWEVMDRQHGRSYIVSYSKRLIEAGVSTHTVRRYLGILRRYFNFVLEHPVVFESEFEGIRIADRYGVSLIQPVSEFDMPRFVYEGERAGIPMDPERLYEFHYAVRESYLKKGNPMVRQRNYAIAVLAGETGLRINELIHLECDKDIFFESKKVQTRFGKASYGSGKRARLTLFPPFARDTLTYYLAKVRPLFTANESGYLFLTRRGEKLVYTDLLRALKDMTDIARKLGVPVQDHMSWHWFRRIFATRFIERCPAKLDVLIELLGHSSPNTVHRYIRHSKAWMDDQIQKVIEGAEKWQSDGD